MSKLTKTQYQQLLSILPLDEQEQNDFITKNFNIVERHSLLREPQILRLVFPVTELTNDDSAPYIESWILSDEFKKSPDSFRHSVKAE